MEWQIAKSKALQYYRQEKYFKSIENAKIWLLWSKSVGNKQEEIEACKILGWSYYYLENYEESIKFGKEEFRVAKEESVKEAQLDAYLVFASSCKKLTPEKRSKETSLYKYASHPGLHQSISEENSQEQASGRSLKRGTSISMAPDSAPLTLPPAQEKEGNKSQEQAAKAERILFESTGESTVNVKWRRLAFENKAKDTDTSREHEQNRRPAPYNRRGLHLSSSKENSQGQASGSSLNQSTSIMAPASAQLSLTPAKEKEDNKSQEKAAKAERFLFESAERIATVRRFGSKVWGRPAAVKRPQGIG
ncbi:uncharacterized protein [Porites lutea]|uniref:uncharacterized protein n=1 Tax=Porites lutea TaxID=51062 RepID=UPI003CC566F6